MKREKGRVELSSKSRILEGKEGVEEERILRKKKKIDRRERGLKGRGEGLN